MCFLSFITHTWRHIVALHIQHSPFVVCYEVHCLHTDCFAFNVFMNFLPLILPSDNIVLINLIECSVSVFHKWPWTGLNGQNSAIGCDHPQPAPDLLPRKFNLSICQIQFPISNIEYVNVTNIQYLICQMWPPCPRLASKKI